MLLIESPNRMPEAVQLPVLPETTVGAVGAVASAEIISVDTVESAPKLLDAYPQADTLEDIAAQRPQVPSPEQRLAEAVRRYSGNGSAAQAVRTRQRNARRVRQGYDSFSPVRQILGHYPYGFRRG